VPVLVGSWSESDEQKILATLDPLAAMATANKEALESLMRDVQTGSEDLAAMLAGLAEQEGIVPNVGEPGQGGDEFDATPEEKGPTRAALGDLWIIGGKHRLLVGDNTIAANVERLMGGKRVGLCFTSPPYAQQREYGDAAKEKCADWFGLMCGTFANVPMTEDGQILVNLGLVHRDGEWVPYWDGWIEWMRSQGWRRFGWYVWDQGWGLPGDWNGRLAPSHEFVFHFNRQSIRPEKWTETKPASQAKGKQSRKRMERGEFVPATRGSDGEVKEMSSADTLGQSHKIPDSVIRIPRSVVNDIARANHPATFSLELPIFVLKSWPGDVYDPYLGSGTTLIAAHRLGRVCYGMEIEPRYADVILRRSEAEGLTVEKAG